MKKVAIFLSVLVLIALVFSLACTTLSVIPYKFPTTDPDKVTRFTTIEASYGDSWNSVLRLLSWINLPIDSADKTSGVMTTRTFQISDADADFGEVPINGNKTYVSTVENNTRTYKQVNAPLAYFHEKTMQIGIIIMAISDKKTMVCLTTVCRATMSYYWTKEMGTVPDEYVIGVSTGAVEERFFSRLNDLIKQ